MFSRSIAVLLSPCARAASLVALGLSLNLTLHAWSSKGGIKTKHGITVEDSVSMAMFASPADPSAGAPHAYFSPNGKYFVLMVRKANIAKDTNDASLLLYRTEDVFRRPEPDVLVTMSSSSSDRYAIRQLRWLDDNKSLVFLGENRGEPSQVYEFEITSRHLRQRTNHPTAVTSYDITGDGDFLAFVAEPPETWPTTKEQEQQREVVISGQDLGNLLAGHHCGPASLEVYWGQANGTSRRIAIGGSYYVPDTPVSWSPTGRYLVFPALLRSLAFRDDWNAYDDPMVKQVFATRAFKTRMSPLQQYLVFDGKTGVLRPLLDAPVVTPFDKFSWAGDGQSLYLSSYLPLEGTAGAERQSREENKFLIRIRLPSLEYQKARTQDFPVQRVDRAPIDVVAEQDLNNPPRIYVSDAMTGRKALLFDPNPQFEELQFGAVKTVNWNVDGIRILGGLYFPPDYVPGKRYPLVIQTHGFVPDEFSMDGHSEWSSGFAARPLAAKGILVLQTWSFKDTRDYLRVSENRRLGATTEEALLKFNNLAYERAIDHLEEDGLIDRDQVGIVGFSRTSCFVGYTLTHSHYHFAAAMLVDGISCGYFEAVAVPEEARDINFVNGGAPPFGAGLTMWIKNAPGFNLGNVNTPVQLISLKDYSILTAWEWYVGLSLENKPVDFILIPDGYHIGIRPSQRIVTEQAAVDWFAFWLKGEKSPDPAQGEQNARWEELRSMKGEGAMTPGAHDQLCASGH
jgi:dipeptidyl aminopeptidase/acylaminoacyl peptidase